MTARQIRRRYYLLSGAHTLAASLIWGVNTLYLLSVGLDMFAVFGVNAVFTASMTLFEIPTGAVADSRGRRVSLQWSAAILLVGTLGYIAAGTWNGGIVGFVAASIVLGIGFTFFSGAAEAWAVDELKSVGEDGTSTGLFATAATASSIMMLIGTTAGGLLGSIDYRLTYILRAGLFLLMFVICTFFLPEKGWAKDKKVLSPLERIRQTAADSMRYGFKEKILRRFMGVSFLLGIFMMWGFYALQPYITDLAGYPGAAWLAGLITAALTLSQIGGQTLAGRGQSKNRVGGLVAWAMAAAAVGAALTGLAGLPSIHSPLMAFVGMALMMGSLGYAAPLQRSALHKQAPSNKRATVVSLDSLVGSGGAILGQPALGWISRRFAISIGYLAGAAVLTLTQPVLALFRRSESEQEAGKA